MNLIYSWSLIPAVVVGFALGALMLWLWQSSHLAIVTERLSAAQKEIADLAAQHAEDEHLKIELAELRTLRETDAEKLRWIEGAQEQMREAFQALASQSLQANSTDILERTKAQLDTVISQMRGDWDHQKTQMSTLVTPIAESLAALDAEVRELEVRREGAYQGMQTQLQQLGEHNLRLQSATATLAQALKSSSVRGRWGEFQLHRVVDMAGMVQHVDFEEQVSTDNGRPDMIIHLPNGAIVPVDSKTPMTSYLDAVETPDERQRALKMRAHADAVKARIRDLSAKSYWQTFEGAAEFVIMFVPNEASLCAAFEQEPGLLDLALEQRVLVATPVTLLALLKSAAFGWQQRQISENLRQIASQGKDIYERLNIFADHLGKTGERLNQAVDAYNKSVGSFRDRVVPAARRLRESGLGMADLEAPTELERQARLLEAE